jgi:GNAT superfamily N-acetyltransferase
MKSESELVSAADENFIASFRKLAEHCAEGATRESGGVFAFATGLPLSLFNGTVVTQPTKPAELEAALQWVSSRSIAHRAWIADALESELGAIPPRHGLKRAPEPYPGMVLHPPRDAPAPSAEVTVAAVAETGLDEFVGVCVEGGLPLDLAQRLFRPSFAGDPEVQLFVGRLGGQPVGTSIAIRSSSASGIYNVGTLSNARRQGIGRALTWAAAAAGRAWGSDVIVLQSSEMALPMYTDMGFRTVSPYTTFTKLAP